MPHRVLVPAAARAAVGILTLAALLSPGLASATLGEPESTVQMDGRRIENGVPVQASIKATERGSYRVHELTLASGTVLREFAGADGTVFAVAWRGPSMPDLRQVLGRYFVNYVAGARANRAGRMHLEVREDGFVAQAGGHMRAFTGRAYLPQALPADLSLGDLR